MQRPGTHDQMVSQDLDLNIPGAACDGEDWSTWRSIRASVTQRWINNAIKSKNLSEFDQGQIGSEGAEVNAGSHKQVFVTWGCALGTSLNITQHYVHQY